MFTHLFRGLFGSATKATPITVLCTTDLSLAAYLLMRGCTLQGWTLMDNGLLAYTLTSRKLGTYVNDWHAYMPIHFSPKAFMKHRAFLKRVEVYRDLSRRDSTPLPDPLTAPLPSDHERSPTE